MTIEKRKKDPNDDEKVKFCFRGMCINYILSLLKKIIE